MIPTPVQINTVYAHALAVVTAVAGVLVAYVPSNERPLESAAISVAAIALSVAILVAHAIRNRATSSVVVAPPAPAETREVAAGVTPGLIAAAVGPAVREELARLGTTTVGS